MKTKEENYKVMQYKELIKYGEEHNIDERLCSYLIKNHLEISNIENNEIDRNNEKKFKKAIKRLKKEPIQYIIGNTNFYGYIYKVTKHTLIPRFETEELVEQSIKIIKEKFKENINIVDIGTGSGCIGITIKKELPNINVTLTDISKKALKIAKYNCGSLDIEIMQGNMLDPLLNKKKKYDVIISNPPYIAFNEEIMEVVRNNEPNIALYAKNNGLFYYEEIFKNANKILNEKFLIALEIGDKQKDDVIALAKRYLSDVIIISKKDLQQRDRMIFIFSD